MDDLVEFFARSDRIIWDRASFVVRVCMTMERYTRILTGFLVRSCRIVVISGTIMEDLAGLLVESSRVIDDFEDFWYRYNLSGSWQVSPFYRIFGRG